MREGGGRERLREGVSGDLNADCDGAVSRQLLTITLMEELRCKGEMARQINPSQFVSVCPGLLLRLLLLAFYSSFFPSYSFCEGRRAGEREMYQQTPGTAN